MPNDSNDFGEFDFGGPIPPDVEDGEYVVSLAEVKVKPPSKDSTGREKGRVIVLECQISQGGASNPDNEKHEGKHVSVFFMPKARDHKYFAMFMREVQGMCKAFDVSPPKVDSAEIANPDAWKPWLDTLRGQSAKVSVKNEANPEGQSFARVRFTGAAQ